VVAAACDSGPEVTPESTFAAEVPESRNLIGRVLAGTESVPGALVRVDVSPGFATDTDLDARSRDVPLLPRTDTTNGAGAYRFGFAPISHDLSIRAGRELFVVRALGVRVYDAPLGVEAAPTGFAARMVPTTSPPTKAGNTVVYFVSGKDARTLTSDAGTQEVRFRTFESTVTLHALEYVASIGPTAAVAHGQVDVLVRDGLTVTPSVPMELLPATAKPVFEAVPPPGYAVEPLEVEIDFGLRTSAVPIARVAAGVPLEMVIVLGARYAVRGRARSAEGAVSDSGRLLFDPFLPKTTLTLPGPISAEAPIDDDAIATGTATNSLGPTTLDANGALAAKLSKGVVEHVLTPESGGGPVIRVVTSSRSTAVPDATAFGLPRPVGRHAWTFQHFPTLPRVDDLAGEDGRVNPASWTSAPRLLVIP
jgi:hypothetical protein